MRACRPRILPQSFVHSIAKQEFLRGYRKAIHAEHADNCELGKPRLEIKRVAHGLRSAPVPIRVFCACPGGGRRASPFCICAKCFLRLQRHKARNADRDSTRFDPSVASSAHQRAGRSRTLLASGWQSRLAHTFDDGYRQLAGVRERQQRARGVDPHCCRARRHPARALKHGNDCRLGACNCLFARSAVDPDDRQGSRALRHDPYARSARRRRRGCVLNCR
jgi:hypothetical protein